MLKPPLFLIIPWLSCFGVVSAQEAKTIRITPSWVKEHPNRFTISCGSAVSGRNGYSITLVLEKEAVCKIHTTFVATKTDYEKSPPDLSMYETGVQTDGRTKVVRLSFSENNPYSLKPIYRIATMVDVASPDAPEFWVETGSYTVDLRDFDVLQNATLAAEKR